MSRVERHPGTFGVRRPNRSVSVGQAWADALLARAQQGNPGVGGRPDSQVPGWASNAVNSTLGGIMGQGSLPEMQRAAAEWAAPALSLPTPGGAMRNEGAADTLNTIMDLMRPVALADVGVAGAAGGMMFPMPGLAPGAAPAAGAARKAGGGIADALRQLLSRGGDEAVSAAAPVVREGRRNFRNVDDLSAAAEPAWPGGPTVFHGTRNDRLPRRFSTDTTGARIPGLYATDNSMLAEQYAGAEGYIHNLRWAWDQAPRVVNISADPVSSELAQAIIAAGPAPAYTTRFEGEEWAKFVEAKLKDNPITVEKLMFEPFMSDPTRRAIPDAFDVVVEDVGGSVEHVFLDKSKIEIAGSARRYSNETTYSEASDGSSQL